MDLAAQVDLQITELDELEGVVRTVADRLAAVRTEEAAVQMVLDACIEALRAVLPEDIPDPENTRMFVARLHAYRKEVVTEIENLRTAVGAERAAKDEHEKASAAARAELQDLKEKTKQNAVNVEELNNSVKAMEKHFEETKKKYKDMKKKLEEKTKKHEEKSREHAARQEELHSIEQRIEKFRSEIPGCIHLCWAHICAAVLGRAAYQEKCECLALSSAAWHWAACWRAVSKRAALHAARRMLHARRAWGRMLDQVQRAARQSQARAWNMQSYARLCAWARVQARVMSRRWRRVAVWHAAKVRAHERALHTVDRRTDAVLARRAWPRHFLESDTLRAPARVWRIKASVRKRARPARCAGHVLSRDSVRPPTRAFVLRPARATHDDRRLALEITAATDTADTACRTLMHTETVLVHCLELAQARLTAPLRACVYRPTGAHGAPSTTTTAPASRACM